MSGSSINVSGFEHRCEIIINIDFVVLSEYGEQRVHPTSHLADSQNLSLTELGWIR